MHARGGLPVIVNQRRRKLRFSLLNSDSHGYIAELLVVILIICIVFSLAVQSYRPLPPRAMLSEIFPFFRFVTTELVVDRLVDGNWPASVQPDYFSTSPGFLRVENIRIDNGSEQYTFRFSRYESHREYRLVFHKIDSSKAATLLWSCGHGKLDGDTGIAGDAVTNVPENILPHLCR